MPRPVSTHKLALAAFARAVRTRTAPERHREDGQRSLSAVLAAYESAITDRTVPLPLAREDPVTRLGAAGLAQLGASPSSAAVRRRLFGVDEAAGRAVAAAEGG